MNDTRTAEPSAAAELAVPGADTPEGALWRALLADSAVPYMLITEDATLMHPGGSDSLTIPDLGRKYNKAVNNQVGRWAVDSLAEEDPAVRALAAEALNNLISYEDHDLACRWVVYEGSIYAFLCGFSPGEAVRHLSRRYTSAIEGIKVELAAR